MVVSPDKIIMRVYSQRPMLIKSLTGQSIFVIVLTEIPYQGQIPAKSFCLAH